MGAPLRGKLLCQSQPASSSRRFALSLFFKRVDCDPGHRVDPDKMVFDGLNSGDVFRGRADRPALPLIDQPA